MSIEEMAREQFEQLQMAMDQRRSELSEEWLATMRAQLLSIPNGVSRAEARGILFESWIVGKVAEMQVVTKLLMDRMREPGIVQ